MLFINNIIIVLIVVSCYHKNSSDLILNKIIKLLKNVNIKYHVTYIYGSYELVNIIHFNVKKYILFILIGLILKKETNHYFYITQSIYNNLIKLPIVNNITIIKRKYMLWKKVFNNYYFLNIIKSILSIISYKIIYLK